jgi:hypothetical protein
MRTKASQERKERQQVIHNILAMKDSHFAARKQAGIPATALLKGMKK